MDIFGRTAWWLLFFSFSRRQTPGGRTVICPSLPDPSISAAHVHRPGPEKQQILNQLRSRTAIWHMRSTNQVPGTDRAPAMTVKCLAASV